MRDRLLRGALEQDADLLVEGDAAALARRIGDTIGGAAVRVHPRFGTATISISGGWRIDLARARRETYPRPGALPEVENATLEEDLARRDFSVNAMAWELPGKAASRGRFHDPFGGADDLLAGRLRILHGGSFRDDPTRILRAVRYANRLDLRIERSTRRRLAEALSSGAFDTISGDRIRKELERTFAEPNAAGALRRASDLGVLQALAKCWKPTPILLRAVARAQTLSRRISGLPGEEPWRPGLQWMVPLLVSTANVPDTGRREIGDRLALTGELRRALERFRPADPGAGASRDSTSTPAAPTRAERIASAALAPAGSARREALRRLLRPPVQISIGGRDLVDAGIPAGPRIGQALAETARAREEGRIRPRQELAFALAAALRAGGGRRA